MSFQVKVLADSMSPTTDRLTTILVTYPRKIHSEMLTHRMLSRSSASSRAIPVAKMLSAIEEDPVIPIWWGANQSGMQAYGEVENKLAAKAWWLEGVAASVAHARRGVEMGLHKQIVNRVVEPAMWITVIISATSWSNLFGLRIHEAAEPHFQKIARMMKEVYDASTPKRLKAGEWHMPLIFDEDIEAARKIVLESVPSGALFNVGDEAMSWSRVTKLLVQASVGRCARVSYLTHEGKRDLTEDVALHDRLMVQEPLHASPGEHVAMALDYPDWFRRKHEGLAVLRTDALNARRMQSRVRMERQPDRDLTDDEIAVEAALSQIQSGNFRGWKSYRKMLPNEHIGESLP